MTVIHDANTMSRQNQIMISVLKAVYMCVKECVRGLTFVSKSEYCIKHVCLSV